MNAKMKLLIAYDGSDCAAAAVHDLRRAGLPPETEALVLSVADVWLPPQGADEDGTPAPIAVQRGRKQAAEAFKAAYQLAESGCELVHGQFPAWETRAEAAADSPAWAIIKRASEWPTDLILVGSQGHSALHRAMLGSVSQKVVNEAPCSVRVARRHAAAADAPVRLVIGVDGSAEADAAVQAAATRVWPTGSEARLITVMDEKMATIIAAPLEAITGWMEDGDENERAWVERMIAAATEKLRAAGLKVSSVVHDGDPKSLLIEEAERWGTDCIFVGARGHGLLERLLIGSVASAVAARAHCSVEVVRPQQTA